MRKSRMRKAGVSDVFFVKGRVGGTSDGKTSGRMKKSWAALICTTGFLGCAEVDYPYLCISLDKVPAIQVDKKGRVALTGLKGDAVVALEYSLARESYTLHFSLMQESAHPAVRVAVSGNNYSLQFHREMNARAPNGVLCASYYPATKTSFGFGWEAGCTAPKLPKAIEFDVVDGSGDVIARESIVFTLRENGSYKANDAI